MDDSAKCRSFHLGKDRHTQREFELDDLLIFGATFREHQDRLRAVLQAFSAAGLQLNLSKCRFGVRSVAFLGDVIDNFGLRPDPVKLQAIDEFPKQVDVTSLKSFLGCISFYRWFVLGFARMASPLYALLKKGRGLEMGERRIRSYATDSC